MQFEIKCYSGQLIHTLYMRIQSLLNRDRLLIGVDNCINLSHVLKISERKFLVELTWILFYMQKRTK